jgi:RNA polymerase sigma factor (sigma-70 family)
LGLTEELLLQQLLRGNEQAFKVLVDTYKNMVYNTVLGFIQQREDAEDITQNVFIKVFETVGGFKKQSKLSTWIYRISVNESLDFIRSRNRKKHWAVVTSLFSANNELLHQVGHNDHPGIITENKEKAAILFNAINKLPDKQKTAFLLQKTQDRSQHEIADIMQLSEGAVESLLIRAKTSLKKLLINYYSA